MKDFITPTSANYTEFLRDYLIENELPDELNTANAVFNQNFSDLFKNHYLMREIGFSTEELFKHHLKSKAEVVMPYYKKKAEALNEVFTLTFESGFSITQTNNLMNTVTNDTNTSVRLEYTRPLGLNNGELPNDSISNGSKNTDTRNGTSSNTGTVTTVYSKNPKFNSLEALTKFQDEFKNIIEDCLKQFDNLFMQIY